MGPETTLLDVNPLYVLRFDRGEAARAFVAQLVDAFATLRIGGSELAEHPVEVRLERVGAGASGGARVYLNVFALHVASVFGLPVMFDGQIARDELPRTARLALHYGADLLEPEG